MIKNSSSPANKANMPDQPSQNNVNDAILDLLAHNKICAKCPKCKKYICAFEVSNSNCNVCGSIDSNKIIVIALAEN